MPCYHPLKAYKLFSGEVVFIERGDVVASLSLPCGRCVGCRLERSRQWAVRCIHEAQMHPVNSFVTLTYDDEHLPLGGSLDYRDFQLFAKRLRKRLGKFRYYMCGEYGEQTSRPHYHACLFGLDFPDKKPIRSRDGRPYLFDSRILSDLWGLGLCSIGAVTFESAAYIARYVMKKQTGEAAKLHYRRVDSEGEVFYLTPEFAHMSLKPGIGDTWFSRFSSDVYPSDQVISNGRPAKPPRRYDILLDRKDFSLLEDIKYRRLVNGISRRADSTDERLAVREQVATARLNLKSRSFER